MRRQLAFLFVALTAWAGGSALGSMGATFDATAETRAVVIGKAHASYVPSLSGSRPIFILVLGSDARTQLGESVDKARSDSIHVVGINPSLHRASVMGFPRDSWVPIPGHGVGKINSAMAYGGPQLTIQTIENLTGLTIDYWVLTGFDGLENIFKEVGDLKIDLPSPVRDTTVKADFHPGLQSLSGKEVLQVARAREQLPYGDFDRSKNQGRILVAALQQFRKAFVQDPSVLFTWISAGMKNIQTDLSLQEVLDLAFTASHVNPKLVQNFVLPATTGFEGTESVVYLSASDKALYKDVSDDGLVKANNVPDFPPA